VSGQVRPYLMADGGNVEFVEIDGLVVKLKLAGACGSCPSSLTTMTMGIKRRLMEKIPVSSTGPDTAAGQTDWCMHSSSSRGSKCTIAAVVHGVGFSVQYTASWHCMDSTTIRAPARRSAPPASWTFAVVAQPCGHNRARTGSLF
jgi:hypothetical protein